MNLNEQQEKDRQDRQNAIAAIYAANKDACEQLAALAREYEEAWSACAEPEFDETACIDCNETYHERHIELAVKLFPNWPTDDAEQLGTEVFAGSETAGYDYGHQVAAEIYAIETRRYWKARESK